MRVWTWFCQFLKKLSAITRCPLYSMSAIERFDCTNFQRKAEFVKKISFSDGRFLWLVKSTDFCSSRLSIRYATKTSQTRGFTVNRLGVWAKIKRVFRSETWFFSIEIENLVFQFEKLSFSIEMLDYSLKVLSFSKLCEKWLPYILDCNIYPRNVKVVTIFSEMKNVGQSWANNKRNATRNEEKVTNNE